MGSLPEHDTAHRDEIDIEYRSDDDEISRLVPTEPSKPRQLTLKKAIEQASFAKWLHNNQHTMGQKARKLTSDDNDTMAYMVKRWEGGEKIITSPRDYQLELFERAKHENTIAVLDTGEFLRLVLPSRDCQITDIACKALERR